MRVEEKSFVLTLEMCLCLWSGSEVYSEVRSSTHHVDCVRCGSW
jgi:hypothetical protein